MIYSGTARDDVQNDVQQLAICPMTAKRKRRWNAQAGGNAGVVGGNVRTSLAGDNKEIIECGA